MVAQGPTWRSAGRSETPGVDVQGVDRSRRGHEEAVPGRAAEAEVGAGLGQEDLAQEMPVGVEDVYPVVPVPATAGR